MTEESKSERPAETQVILSEMISQYKDIVAGLTLELQDAIDHQKEYVKHSKSLKEGVKKTGQQFFQVETISASTEASAMREIESLTLKLKKI